MALGSEGAPGIAGQWGGLCRVPVKWRRERVSWRRGVCTPGTHSHVGRAGWLSASCTHLSLLFLKNKTPK